MTEEVSDGTQAPSSADKAPRRHVYFYYLKPAPQEDRDPEHHSVEVYFMPARNSSRPSASAVKAMMDKADKGDIVPVGFNIRDLDWRYPGYLIFALRHPTVKLRGPRAVTFEYTPNAECSERTADSVSPDANHSFDFVDDFAFDDASGVIFLNKRKNRHNRDLDEKDRETFCIRFDTDSAREILTHTENGTNTGP